ISQDIATAYTALKRRINVQPTRGTPLFEISVMSRDPNEAANTANEIANVYRAQVRESDKADHINVLEKELLKQADQTNRLTAELAILTDKSSLQSVRKTKELESAMLT